MDLIKKNKILEDYKINVKLKLSALWTSLIVCYIYGDFFSLFVPGAIEDMIAKVTPIGETTPTIILAFAISMAIPAVMISLSLLLKPNINRWLNIIVGSLYTIIMALTMINPTPWTIYYMFLGVIEIALSLLIIRYALKWPKQEA
ncbi:DUF6326 family protein [Aquimarina macrocephali]|uniref:DUF6326 family protein n=1 Tax=Aquimarina macrocephali TaxID=666563 RepID=UPI00046619B0|nr:DUF6326 family protein [Aquimarina macrocephali]